MGISFRKDKMTKGRIDNADVAFSDTKWLAETSKNGKDLVYLVTTFLDEDGGEVGEQRWLLGQQDRVIVNDEGGIESVDPDREYRPSLNSGVGKLMASLEDLGVSAKTLDAIGDDPSVLDGIMVHVEQKGSGRKDNEGREYTDLVVTEILEAKAKGKGKGKASKPAKEEPASKGKAGKKAKPAKDEDDDEDEDEVDPIVQAARDTVLAILESPEDHVKGYDEDAGGVTPKQLQKGAFTAFEGASKDKGKVSAIIAKVDFLNEGAEAGLWAFDEDEGLVSAV